MKKLSIETMVGVFVLIGLACVAYLTVKLGKLEVLGDDNYRIFARFNNVSGLKTGAIIDMAGVQIGKVDSISLDKKDKVAVVWMKIEKSVPIAADAIASVKTAGLIGDKYIKIAPGGAEQTLKEGEEIVEVEDAVDLEELVKKYAFGNV